MIRKNRAEILVICHHFLTQSHYMMFLVTDPSRKDCAAALTLLIFGNGVIGGERVVDDGGGIFVSFQFRQRKPSLFFHHAGICICPGRRWVEHAYEPFEAVALSLL